MVKSEKHFRSSKILDFLRDDMIGTNATTLFLLCLLAVCLCPLGATRDRHRDSMNRWVPVSNLEGNRQPDSHRRPTEQRFRELDLAVGRADSVFQDIGRSNIVDVGRDHRQTNRNKNDWKPNSSGVTGRHAITTPRPNFWMATPTTTPRPTRTMTTTPTTVARRLTTTQSRRHRPTPSTTNWIDQQLGTDGNAMQIPMPFLKELKNITSPIDFLNRYVVEAPGMNGNVQSGRNHSFVSSIMRERTLSPFAHAAGCTPQPTTVPVQADDRTEQEPFVMYFPSCTRIERCDGCCNTDLLECQPTKTEMATLQVLRVKYLGPSVNKFDISEPVVVELERHLQCDCLCRIKESDCRFYQTYRPNECRCECSNQHESVDCVGERLWDPHTCQCRCRQHHDCSTGYFFNDLSCTCEVMKTRAKPAFRGF